MADARLVHGGIAKPHPFVRRARLHADRRGFEPADHGRVAARPVDLHEVLASHDLGSELVRDLRHSDIGKKAIRRSGDDLDA